MINWIKQKLGIRELEIRVDTLEATQMEAQRIRHQNIVDSVLENSDRFAKIEQRLLLLEESYWGLKSSTPISNTPKQKKQKKN